MSATNRGVIRKENDFYPTPITTIEPLISLIDWSKVYSFLEPCKGDCAILNLVKDLVVHADYCEILEGIEYLSHIITKKYDLIITNPPFSLAQEFLEKSLQESDCVCYLLRLNFLGSQKRKEMWSKIGTPDKLLILSKRPSFTGKGTDACEYAWFCWDKNDIIKLNKGIHII